MNQSSNKGLTRAKVQKKKKYVFLVKIDVLALYSMTSYIYIHIFPCNLSIYPKTMTLTHKKGPQGTPFLEYFTFRTYLSAESYLPQDISYLCL